MAQLGEAIVSSPPFRSRRGVATKLKAVSICNLPNLRPNDGYRSGERTSQLSRRSFLQGIGVTMALPWMESIRTLGASASTSASTTGQAPLRALECFAGNGFHSREWKAEGTGENMQLGRVLESLIPHRNHMHFIRGLYNAQALKGNIHSSQTGNLLSGAPLASGGDIRSVRAWIK